MTIQKAVQGTTIFPDMIAEDENGDLTDPTNLAVDVIDPNDVVVANNIGPIRDSLGHYHIVWPVDENAAKGLWRLHWTGVVGTLALDADDYFQVVGEGEFVFPTDDNDYLRWLLDDWAFDGRKYFFDDTKIMAFLSRHNGNIYLAAADGWAVRAAYYHKMIDLEGSIRRGTNPEYQRPYSQLYKQAKDMVDHFRDLAKEAPLAPGVAVSRGVVGYAINLREGRRRAPGATDTDLFTGWDN